MAMLSGELLLKYGRPTNRYMGKPTFQIGRYVSLYRCDESGLLGEIILLEAQLTSKIVEGKDLVVSTVEAYPESKEISLGVVQETKNYKKKGSIVIHTTQGWWYIVRNENLETLLASPLDWGD